MKPSDKEKVSQEESKIITSELVGFFDLLAKYDFEDSKKLALETANSPKQDGVVISDANQTQIK